MKKQTEEAKEIKRLQKQLAKAFELHKEQVAEIRRLRSLVDEMDTIYDAARSIHEHFTNKKAYENDA